MQVKLRAFAQAQNWLGFAEKTVECDAGESPRELLQRLAPGFDPAGARVAIDCEYGDWDAPIGAASELALIPPVSGG